MDNKNNVINIAYCTDANYLEYVAVSIMSVIMNNPEQDLSFFVFVYDVTDEEINKLRSTSDKIQVINIDKEEIEKYNNDFAIKHLNRSTYMRLAVPRLLKDKVEHFIYLDADTLCFDKLNDINSIDISNVICAVSHDSLDIHDTKNAKRLGLSTGHYFNAGFLYINIENWIKFDIENKANTVLFEQGKALPYFDQDALNIAMDGNVKFIDNRWNFCSTGLPFNKKRYSSTKKIFCQELSTSLVEGSPGIKSIPGFHSNFIFSTIISHHGETQKCVLMLHV